jgi:hypothetical protein
MSDWSTFDDTFFLTLAGLLIGVCGLSIRFCYRSKCKKIDLCGIHIERDVDVEEVIDTTISENKSEDNI